jgi:thiamine biosynthesis lipoprotein ApbE
MSPRPKTLLVAAALLMCLSARLARADDVYEGKVVEVTAGKLMVLGKSGETLKFDVPSSCKITRNEKKANLDDLVAGDRVTIQSTRKGETLTANSIAALAAE